MLALRAVPNMAMQGKGGTTGMGDDYNFDNTQKGNIYSAWGWGYTITQMPGGAVAQLYGAKNTWLWFMSAAGASSLFIPIGAALGGAGGAIYVVVFLSFVSGLGQGPLYPGKEGLFGSWIPLSEMAFAQGFINGWWSGGQAFAQLLTPAIMIYLGWEYAYYFFGGFVLLFCWSWKVWAYNTPEDDPKCSPEERALIAEGKGESDESQSFDPNLYWAILAQKPIFIFMVRAVLRGYSGSYFNILPYYLEQQGGFSVTMAGIVSAVQGFGKIVMLSRFACCPSR